jgi:hypothetical protein
LIGDVEAEHPFDNRQIGLADTRLTPIVMAGLDPAIHVFASC